MRSVFFKLELKLFFNILIYSYLSFYFSFFVKNTMLLKPFNRQDVYCLTKKNDSNTFIFDYRALNLGNQKNDRHVEYRIR